MPIVWRTTLDVDDKGQLRKIYPNHYRFSLSAVDEKTDETLLTILGFRYDIDRDDITSPATITKQGKVYPVVKLRRNFETGILKAIQKKVKVDGSVVQPDEAIYGVSPGPAGSDEDF